MLWLNCLFLDLLEALIVSFLLFLLFLLSHRQVLGDKPQLSEGGDDDDTEADMSNRKMAKLYMVQY